MQRYFDQMDFILSDLFKKYASFDIKPGVLLSGGIDSTTITYFVSKYFKDFTILSMGTDKTKDRSYIDIVSLYLKHEYIWVEMNKDEVVENYKEVKKLLEQALVPTSLMHMSLAMGYFLLFKKAKQLGITHIVTGQGPDILLGGYHKYKSVTNINVEIKKDLPLLEIDKKRDGIVAKNFGITLYNPYLEKEFVDFCLTIPQKFKLQKGIEKYILREFSRKKGLPSKIVNRPKKAFQYSTGIQKLVLNVLKYTHE
ncbi:hypothetical protein A2334_02395 [Candidatus Roizmanbacteria bacterium RIFOXYB2_FULL_38_10]|uniref:Asparagine synthetase domain-containing protein n=1 Tax=Candidatus Roizmanbacteria bacterium RIFOXYD1_FULL_38_12 TaxID=1802093 RepID=A0A1F7L020_9BACT|nr:MAG: hypothetical protein A3K47_01575 [Candidatus Roizmanbacteria bacterium RIFOXYA2_FULL_38_14]OGK63474.1 MAG: hypothetical protein A3K27_01575 [Candidatus Roizmanbacteria bacterium RIFOXYA1_FULL_37_12]OGK65320.1 MAG: hypothetical protein A3K38_01575 [Candidatus Roizmanbacteria bacterium RIFOXYB1_FULL_40_23]OGK67966.1 MAG: hypothetical protein A2334_02395 [Candidatus Roizmanbacteria bacterium RIFOXYB2_FULL_38_10]OGK69725.1 MAG: hypothetical protein A3K21_01580 [Candidatus Roizmanbacteria ba